MIKNAVAREQAVSHLGEARRLLTEASRVQPLGFDQKVRLAEAHVMVANGLLDLYNTDNNLEG